MVIGNVLGNEMSAVIGTNFAVVLSKVLGGRLLDTHKRRLRSLTHLVRGKSPKTLGILK